MVTVTLEAAIAVLALARRPALLVDEGQVCGGGQFAGDPCLLLILPTAVGDGKMSGSKHGPRGA